MNCWISCVGAQSCFTVNAGIGRRWKWLFDNRDGDNVSRGIATRLRTLEVRSRGAYVTDFFYFMAGQGIGGDGESGHFRSGEGGFGPICGS